MNTNTLIQLATLTSVAAAVIGLLISVRAYKRQVSAYFLLEYTRRFEQAVQSLPLRVWAVHLYPDEELPESSEEIRLGIFRCLTCLSQIHYFSHKGYIPKSSWKRVEMGFSQILRSPIFLHEWKNFKPI